MRRRDRAALGEEAHRICRCRVACCRERLPFERGLVRFVQEHRQLLAQSARQPAEAELIAPFGDPLAFALLAFDGRERRLQRLGRRLAVTSLAALVEVHRCRGKRERDRRRLDGLRRMAVIFSREIAESEFVVARGLPKKIRIELRCKALGVRDQRRRRWLGEAQQDRSGLDLQALARNRFDLQRRVVVGEDGPGLQLAVVLEENVHGKGTRGKYGPGSSRYAANYSVRRHPGIARASPFAVGRSLRGGVSLVSSLFLRLMIEFGGAGRGGWGRWGAPVFL